MIEPTDPTTAADVDPQAATDAAEAVEPVQAWLDACDRIAEANGGWDYAFGPEDTVFADGLRALLADRARTAAELEQMEDQRDETRQRLTGAQARLDYLDSRMGAVHTMAFLESELARTKAELEQVRGDLARARDDSSEVWLAERNEVLRGAISEAAGLIDRLADDDACEIDHNGYCQTHNLHSAPCPHPLGRRFAETWRTVQSPAAEKASESHAPGGPHKIPPAPGVESRSEAPGGRPEGAPVDTEPAPRN